MHPSGILLGRGPLERLWWMCVAWAHNTVLGWLPIAWSHCGGGWREHAWLYFAATAYGCYEKAEGRL